jgi:hypothetical protein
MSNALLYGATAAVGLFLLGWWAGWRSHRDLAIGSLLIGVLVFLSLAAVALFTTPRAFTGTASRSPVHVAPGGSAKPSTAELVGDAAGVAAKGVFQATVSFFRAVAAEPKPPPKPKPERD